MTLLLLGGMGLPILITGLVWGGKRYALSRNGLRAPGTVVENYKEVTKYSDKTSTSYYPIIEFTTQKEERIRFKGSTGMQSPEYEVGAPVDVLYDPADPNAAQMAAFPHLWLGPLVVTILGFIMVSLGVGLYFIIGADER